MGAGSWTCQRCWAWGLGRRSRWVRQSPNCSNGGLEFHVIGQGKPCRRCIRSVADVQGSSHSFPTNPSIQHPRRHGLYVGW